MSSSMGQSSFKFAAAQDLNDLAKELGSVSSFKTKVFKYFLKLDQKQHGCTAKQHFFLFVVFLYCCIYIHCISFNFVIRLRLILQIFSIHNSFICFFIIIIIANHQLVYPANRVSFDLPRLVGKRKEPESLPLSRLIQERSKRLCQQGTAGPLCSVDRFSITMNEDVIIIRSV